MTKLPTSREALKTQLATLQDRLTPRLRRVLAIATDGCVATGAVLRNTAGVRLEIEALATSRAIQFEAAAEEIVSALKVQNVVIPKSAMLATASFLPAVLELPVPANKALPAGKMLEMIRWELEPLFAQQIELWSIGNLLCGRGHLSEAQRRNLLETQRAAQATSRGRGGRAAARFGELAIENDYVSREQVEECLALQEQLQMVDAEIAIAWHHQPVGPGGDPGQSAWLCAGINPVVRSRWVGALERLGLRLAWIYPLAGASAPLTALAGLPIGVELHGTIGVCYRAKDGALAQLVYRQFPEFTLSLADTLLLAQPLLRPDDRGVGVYPGGGTEVGLTEALSGEWKRDITTLQHMEMLSIPTDRAAPDAVIASLAGTAARSMELVPAGLAVRFPGSRPPPPVYRRPAVWMSAAAGLVVAVVGGFELNGYRAEDALKKQHQALSARQAVLESRKREAEAALRTGQEARKKLEAAKAELQSAEFRKRLYETLLSQRNRFMETLLDALIDLITDEVVLQDVAETGWQRVEIQGFALSVDSVYRYARAVAEDMEKFDIELGDVDTGEAVGPLDMKGYRFTFTLFSNHRAGA